MKIKKKFMSIARRKTRKSKNQKVEKSKSKFIKPLVTHRADFIRKK